MKNIMRRLRIHGALGSCQKTGTFTVVFLLSIYQDVKFKREIKRIIKNPQFFWAVYFSCFLRGEKKQVLMKNL